MPPYRILLPFLRGHIDRAVYAANPAMCALAEALDRRHRQPATLDNAVLLSVGTGVSLTCVKGRSVDWGYGQWARPLVSLMLDGVFGSRRLPVPAAARPRYQRLDPLLPPKRTYEPDDWRKVPEMVAFAEEVDLRPDTAFLRAVWR